MRIRETLPVFNDNWKPDGQRHKSLAVPGLVLSVEQLALRYGAGTETLSDKQRAQIYDSPDRDLSQLSPNVSRFTLAERQELIDRISAEQSELRKRVSDFEEQQRLFDEQQKREALENELREKIQNDIRLQDNK